MKKIFKKYILKNKITYLLSVMSFIAGLTLFSGNLYEYSFSPFGVPVGGGIKDISVGYSHWLVLTNGGSVWAGGENLYGQVGVGTFSDNEDPVKIFDGGCDKVFAGLIDSFVLKSNGEVWAFGSNEYGQLGTGDDRIVSVPVKIFDSGIKKIAPGLFHTLFLKDDGSLLTCGKNGYGELCLDNHKKNNYRINKVFDSGIKDIAAGRAFSLVLKDDGTLLGAGVNTAGQLGLEPRENKRVLLRVIDTGVAKIGAGLEHTVYIKSDGKVYTLGRNIEGQYGNGTLVNIGDVNTYTPVLTSNSGIKDILPGQDGTFFIKDNGTLAGCGRNIENQLLIHNQRLVFQVTDLKNSVAKACIGDGFSLVLDDSGSLTVYGTQSPVVFTQSIPDESAIAEREHISSVKKILDSGVKAVRAEKRHRLIVMEDGSLWGYGSNFHGELGQSSAEYFYNPVKIMNANVADVEPGLDYTLILMDNGDVYACGKNSDGQLGTGDLQDKFSPVKVFSDAISVSAGCNHSIFLKSDLSLWACGTNNYGQFGDGGKADVPQTSIVKIVDSNVGSAAAGYYYTVYSSATPGYLYAAGNNIVGQLGHGRIGGDYFTFEFSPSQDIKKVFAFGMTTFMIDKNDALFGYGNNCSGLINPSLLYHDMERYKIEIFKSGVEDVASSYTNTVVLMKDSSVMVSGSNFNGQLSRPGQFLVNETFTKMADGGVKSIAACDNAVLLSFNQYEITFQSGQHGHLDGELTQKVNAGGDSTSVTAIADDGYFFTGWTGDITTSDNPIIVKNVQKDLQLNASFEPVADAVLLTLTPSDKGVLSPSEGSFNVKINTPQHITAQPADGYSFNKWTIVSGNVAFDDSNAADTNITLSSDAVVTAEFTPDGNNRAPVAKEDFYVVDLNNTVTISSSNGVLANDADPDGDTMAAILQKLPDFGTVTLNSDGSFTYDPVSYQCPLDSFTYMASDGTLVSKPVTVHLKYKKNIIVNVNDDSFSTSKNTPLNISAPGILGNDSVTFMIPITAEVAELPKHGTLQLNDDGSFSYTPDTDYTGQDYFKYKADTGNVSAVGTVLLNVLEDAHGEIIQNGLVLWLDGNDIDGDGVAEGLSEDGVDSNGDITVWKDKSSQHNDAVSDNNNIKPQLEINSFNGKPVVKYSRLSDRSSSVSKFQEIQDIRTVFWVIFENDQTFTFLSGDFHRGTSELWNIYSGNQNVFDGDSKVFNNTLWGRNDNLPPKKWIIFTHRTVGPAKGDTIVRDNNDYNYDRTILFAETLVYNRVLTDEECIAVQNALYNKWFKSPTAVDDSYQVNKNQALTSIQVEGVSANDFLPQEFPEYCIIVTQQPAHGILQMYDNGSFIYTPDSDYTGSDSFKYYIENKWYKTNEATVSMTVTDKQLYSLTVNNGKGDGIFEEGSRIMIAADENNSADKIFSHWSGDSDKLSDPYIPNTFVTMPAENITVTAEYKSVVTSNILYSISGVVSGDEIDGVTITVQNSDGDEIARTATSAGGAYKFENLPPGTYTVKPESASAAFSPTERQAVLVCSNLIGVNFESSVQKYNLTVTNGTGTGTYTPGAQVPITADTPASGMVFDRWNVTAGGDASIVDNQYSASAIITMPKNDVTVEALYKNSTPGDDPTSIAGCVLWLDGADPNGDGSTVSGALDTWKDKSGNGNDAVQNDSAKQPSVVSAELNGKSVVTFDGTDDSFSFSEIADVKTVFWILKEENQTSDGSNLHFLLGDSSKYDFHRGSGTLWDSTYVADGIKNGVTRVDRADFDGLNTDIPADKYVMVTLLASEDLTASQITKDRDIGRSWDGGIAEIIIYNQALSDTDRDSVETYLYNKWFGTAPVTYSITGTVSGDIQQGVTVAVDATHSAVTDASGNYTISGLADGTYTVIPTLAGYTFTPATASATVAGADVTGVNFSSAQNAAPQFTLTVNNGTGSGQYAENDSVTISATVPAGQVFDAWTGDTQYLADASAASTTVTMPAQDVTVTATFKQAPPNTHSISGTVTGDIQQGVTVAVDPTHSAVTDASGNYTISGLADGTYTVTPTLAGYTFTPATASATLTGADVTGVNFISTQNAAPQFTLTVNNGTGSGQYAENDSVTISATVPAGQVFDAWTGDTQYLADSSAASTTVTMPAQDVTVTATFKQAPPNSHSISGTITGDILQGVTVAVDPTHSATTDASGNYTISGLADGTYTVTPALPGYTFAPATATATLAGADVTGVDFVSTQNAAPQFNLTVNNGTGSGQYAENDSVTISATVPAGQVFDAWTGDTQYLADASAASTTVTMPAQDVAITATFKQAPPNTHSISGTITGDILQGVTVAVDPTHSATTDASGNYTISGLADGTYTVTPTLAGYTFTPATATATLAGADVTGVDFVSTQNAAPQFTLTVNNGTGSGQYAENDSVTISAAVPAGQVFDAWTGDTQYLADASIVSTTVTMPAQNITVTATFKQPPPNTHSISGTVTGVIQQGVTVAVDATHSAVTDASGNYTISGLADGTYTVTPTLAGYTFTPATATAAIAGDDISGVDFSASEEISENSLPVSIEDSYNMIDGTPLNVEEASGVLANDIDMDGDELTAVLVKAPQNGTLNLNADGSFTFNNDSFVGVVTFSYLANDATDDGNTVSVTINILPAGSDIPPSAVGDKYECAQDSTLSVPVETGVLVNDINASGASVSLLVQANHGTITLNQDGSFTFTPEKGFSGIDSFEYALDNITPQVSAKVSIIVMPVNITLGTILTFNSNEIVGLNGKTLLKPPKLYGLFPNNKKGGFKKIKASTTETFSGAWGKKYALYDKKALKTGYKSYFDSNGALSNQPVKVFMKGKTTDKAKIDTEIKTVYLVPPVFTAFTNAKGEAITSISAGKPITVVGKYFGDKLPKVFLELPDGKKLKCKIDKAALKYTNFKGKQSPMDPLSGESLIIITVPAGKVTPGTYPLIIDNKIGIATTPHVDDNNRGSLPLLTIE